VTTTVGLLNKRRVLAPAELDRAPAHSAGEGVGSDLNI